MTSIVPFSDGNAARTSQRYHELSFTWKETKKAGLVSARSIFDQGSLAAQEMVRKNNRGGAPPEQWEMGRAITVALTRPYVQSGEVVMNAGLMKKVDPNIDRIEKSLHPAAEVAIAAAGAAWQDTHTFKETGNAYSVEAAIEQIKDDNARIHDDEEAGLTHHKPAPAWLRVFGAVSPFLELVALLAWLTWLWNVDWLRPLQNPLRWATAAVLVIVLTVAVAFTAKSAGMAHNHGRQEAHDGNRHAAERHFLLRNWMLVPSLVLGAIVSGTIVARGIQALDRPTGYEVTLVVLVSLVAGFALPGLAYAAKATHGSLYSRRRADLEEWGHEVEEKQTTDMEVADSLLGESARIEQNLVSEALPKVAEDAITEVYGAVQPYEWAYIQIGVDNITLPARPSVRGFDDDGKPYIVQSITCGLDNAPALDLQPIKDRMNRIDVLHRERLEREEALKRIKPIRFMPTI